MATEMLNDEITERLAPKPKTDMAIETDEQAVTDEYSVKKRTKKLKRRDEDSRSDHKSLKSHYEEKELNNDDAFSRLSGGKQGNTIRPIVSSKGIETE